MLRYFTFLRKAALLSTFLLLFSRLDLWAQQGQPNRFSSLLYMAGETAVLPGQEQKSDGTYLLFTERSMKLEQLHASGYEVVRRLSDKTFLVRLKQEGAAQRLQDVDVRPANLRWKLSPGLEDLQPSEEKQTFLLQLDKLPDFLAQLPEGLQVLEQWPAHHALAVEASPAYLFRNILPHPLVRSVEAWGQKPKTESLLLDANLSVNRIAQTHHHWPGLRGQNQTVSIKEERYNTDDLDLLGKHVPGPLEAPEASQHATDMATHIAGSATLANRTQGVVPLAQLSSSDFMALFPDPISYFQEYGIATQNHSYGTQIENYYGQLAAAYDAQTSENTMLMHVFSSGNSGLLTPAEGTYAGLTGWANLTGNFKQSKNTLSVAALDTLLDPEVLVSRGPAYDGRIKPELTAYSAQGSSSSAALLSGATVLLQQAYQQANGALPSAALLRALLLNSAQDLDSPGPDFISGYGNLDVYRTLENLEMGNYTEDVLENSAAERTLQLQLPASARRLKIMLSWLDVPAQVNDAKALVNDLELEVLGPDGKRWKPWVLSSYPHPDSLSLPAKRGEDHLNNQEQVFIDVPVAGTYTIRVSAYDLPEGNQPFALAWQWEEAESFRWTYPGSVQDNMPHLGEGGSIFRWQTSLEGEGSLWWRSSEAGSWQLIEENVDLAKGYYSWRMPLQNPQLAQARLLYQDQSYESSWFTISDIMRPSVGFQCADSVLLQWPAEAGISAYRIYAIEGNALAPVADVGDTLFLFEKSAFEHPYFAVAPLISENTPGLRSLTFDYRLQGVDCFVMSFSSQPVEPEGVRLNLLLGTTYALQEVSFEKEGAQGFELLHTISEPDSRQLSALDLQPRDGANIYRVKLRFANGEVLYSNQDTVFLLQKSSYLLFPNPVISGGELRLLTPDDQFDEFVLKLYTNRAEPVYEVLLFTGLEEFQLPPLAAGLYLYRLEVNGQTHSGRLIIQ